MPERDTKRPETAEEFGQELLKFVEEAEFGTPQYQAISDYLYLKQEEQSLSQLQKNVLSKDHDPAGKIYWESQARISEQKIAILEFQIYQNQSQIKGYDNSYTSIAIGYEHTLGSTAYKEARGLFPDDEEQQGFYVEEIFEGFFE